jgi:hypothetical protein
MNDIKEVFTFSIAIQRLTDWGLIVRWYPETETVLLEGMEKMPESQRRTVETFFIANEQEIKEFSRRYHNHFQYENIVKGKTNPNNSIAGQYMDYAYIRKHQPQYREWMKLLDDYSDTLVEIYRTLALGYTPLYNNRTLQGVAQIVYPRIAQYPQQTTIEKIESLLIDLQTNDMIEFDYILKRWVIVPWPITAEKLTCNRIDHKWLPQDFTAISFIHTASKEIERDRKFEKTAHSLGIKAEDLRQFINAAEDMAWRRWKYSKKAKKQAESSESVMGTALADQFAELASAIRDGLPPRAAVKESGLPLAVYESLQKICWD